jgi:glycosyltransferase involved in cell wall biosynthesis
LDDAPARDRSESGAGRDCELTILMPCLNEAETLARCIDKARSFLRHAGVDGEILVADNGSSDGSQAIARTHGARVVEVPTRGYGAALSGGIAAAHGQFVVMADADDSYEFSDLGAFVAELRGGADLVMGNRFRGGIAPGAMPPLHRYLGNPVLSGLGRLFFGIPCGDFHCGLRGFRRDAILRLDLRTTGMEFASEMVVRAALCGLVIREVPATLAKDGRSRPPHLRTWHDGWRHLRFLLMYSPRWLFIYSGFAMMAAGLGTALLVLPGPTEIADGVFLDVHTLLVGCMAILVGLQSVSFGLLAWQYANAQGLIPASPRLSPLLRWLTLERMLLIAGAAFLLGMTGFGATFYRWSAVHFGPLQYRSTMRLLIVSLTLIVGGIQLGLSAFLAGVMQIRHR